jgi:hypothetical protein
MCLRSAKNKIDITPNEACAVRISSVDLDVAKDVYICNPIPMPLQTYTPKEQNINMIHKEKRKRTIL